ncbi:MAG: hypothetical protein GVY07_14290 [Bacteroidetes bacterium]|jgi:hypothetical protein|nr:hypothetical protein [Bacteroidota bacterium]
MTVIDYTCVIVTPKRGGSCCNPGWRPDEERSSKESPQPGDRSILQPRNPEAIDVEKAGDHPRGSAKYNEWIHSLTE